MKTLHMLLLLLGFSISLHAQSFNIIDYGAVADGKTPCTEAINKAISAASEAGGGTVYAPAGTWLSGTIFLKSHVTLHLESGCTILGSTDLAEYPIRIPGIRSYTDNYTKRSLVYAENQQHIGIEGKGTLDGHGGSFPIVYGGEKDYIRPYLIRIIGCKDVRINDITMQNSAMWNQHYLACEQVQLNNVRVWNFCNYNNDGVDIDGCRDVTISNSFFYSIDDGITLKSTSAHPCEGVVITNCISASRSSGIKMGTETNGGFKDITISNCSILPVPKDAPRPVHGNREGLTAIELLIADGGTMDGVTINNMTIKGYIVPIGVILCARGRRYLPTPTNEPERLPVGAIRNVSLSNIIATGAEKNCGILLAGVEGHCLENVSLSNILIKNAGKGSAETTLVDVKEHTYDYPQAAFWGELPGYGLYARHIRGLNINNVQFQTEAEDGRHAMVLDDVHQAKLSNISCMSAVGNAAILKLKDAQQVLVNGWQPQSEQGAFLKLEGNQNQHIGLMNNDFRKVKQVIEKPSHTSAKVIRMAGNIE